eukprot:CAMPEP_0185182870 /NCGR_PEP_ID=MMETSP1140-20130426/1625_1 /TAXON_ID=298111 /ORGANISM="Pavlova sp., Strain CCMP459" /LENGTH=408 /DNA_ID=CAMNT_0027748841 /DNA_START=25 /DNA_END=1251 /DNA_ORIENTATION=+
MEESQEAARERAAVQTYLAQHKINDMLCSMLEEMCIQRPSNPHQFLVDWMCSQYPQAISMMGPSSAAAEPEIKSIDEEDDDMEDDDKFETEAAPEPGAASGGDISLSAAMTMNRTAGSRRRSAVSAESVDPSAIANAYTRQVHEKSADLRARLKKKAEENFLFSSLDTDQMGILLDAMFEKTYSAGDAIIKQGDQGDNFYIVFSGECEVWLKKDGVETNVLTCGEGDSFGELALLYNAPRAATVKAKTDVTLYAVDRITFKFIMMDTTITKRSTYEGFLEQVPLLSSLTKNERQTIADALKPVEYKDGEDIITQGEVGNTFYILEKGNVVCTSMEGGEKKELKRCSPGDYFGEIALLTNRPRAATVTAEGDVCVLALDRRTFTRVLGPLTDVLKRNMAMYNAYMVHKI